MKTSKSPLRLVFVIFAIMLIVTAYHILGCPFRFVLGLPCPGCGMTRAWLAAMRFDFHTAFRMHPLFLLAPPLLILAFQKRQKRLAENILIGIAIIFIVVYVVRMVYLFPDTEPMVLNQRGLVQRIFNAFRT